jgi:ribonuclease P protein component
VKYLRIKKNTHFQKLFKKGKKVFSPNITLLYFPSDKLSMGVAVSKKHGKAVKRNRIKRLLRAAFSDCCNMLERPFDIILIPKTEEEYTYEAFKKSLKICFKKVNGCKDG